MLYYKALHIIFVVTWFAGLFYIVRLFIYHVEANNKPEPEKTILASQYKLMQKRLWFGITWPSMILAILFGTILLMKVPTFLYQPFMQLKLGFVALLVVYHFLCQRIYKQLKNNICKWTSSQLRLWNELATLFLVSIVFLIVLKSTISFVWGVVGLVLFAVLLMLGIKIYKRIRER